MTKKEFLEELASILKEDPEAVTPEAKLESFAGWDSLGLLGAVALLDGDLGVTIDVDKLRACVTPQDLMNLAEGKLQ